AHSFEQRGLALRIRPDDEIQPRRELHLARREAAEMAELETAQCGAVLQSAFPTPLTLPLKFSGPEPIFSFVQSRLRRILSNVPFVVLQLLLATHYVIERLIHPQRARAAHHRMDCLG